MQKYKREEARKTQERDQRMKQRAGRVSHSPDAFSGNSLDHKGRMVDGEQPEEVLQPNASQMSYELFQPQCLHRFWKTTKRH